MSITYPISPPASPKPAAVRLTPMTAVAVSQSPFTGTQQVYQHQAQLWGMTVTLPRMQRANAEQWVSFLLKLRGQKGTFSMGDPAGATPRGVATGSPVVNGASQVGDVLNTAGWTASQTGILKAGDYVQIGTRLFKALEDADSDGTGAAALTIWPRLMTVAESPANGAALVVNDAKAVWRLPPGFQTEWEVDTAMFYGIEFQAIEARES